VRGLGLEHLEQERERWLEQNESLEKVEGLESLMKNLEKRQEILGEHIEQERRGLGQIKRTLGIHKHDWGRDHNAGSSPPVERISGRRRPFDAWL
jgi:hypothetical protein